ncbi:DUF3298 and DUF4163 domain-containing protein [Niameybacter massiliensis]|uniref:DUF3298 and DUF4163 domain-containing protein n=1 Tax=Niameybacter massiliensis TaxID=1658108 RepID=UPI0006B59B6C|nr:DUF3298 and DUF4163 domain-containing protein [Niameybacter massiliensis]
MKKRLVSIILIIICVLNVVPCTSLYAKEEPVEPIITVKYEDIDEIFKDKDGVIMLSVQGNSPSVTIPENKKASLKINTYYKKLLKVFKQREKEYIKLAEQDYQQRTKEQQEYWHGYELGETYSTGRADDKVISFIDNYYEYTGGAHPNGTRFAQTFSTKTGERLTLNEILTDVPKATEFINNFILKETKKYEYKDYFFEGYEKDIKDILTEDTWYLSDKGLVVVANEYIISPHAVGILEFTIPYEQFSYLKLEYLPQ